MRMCGDTGCIRYDISSGLVDCEIEGNGQVYHLPAALDSHEGLGGNDRLSIFITAVMPDTESDDLLVHVVVDGEIVETRRLAGDDSETQYGVIPHSRLSRSRQFFPVLAW